MAPLEQVGDWLHEVGVAVLSQVSLCCPGSIIPTAPLPTGLDLSLSLMGVNVCMYVRAHLYVSVYVCVCACVTGEQSRKERSDPEESSGVPSFDGSHGQARRPRGYRSLVGGHTQDHTHNTKHHPQQYY